jgi:hypothetical protein
MSNATFNSISVISWLSVSLVEETGVPGENHRPATSHWQTLSRNVVLSTPGLSGIRSHNVSGPLISWRKEKKDFTNCAESHDFHWFLMKYRYCIYFTIGHHGHDRMVVGFITAYAISANCQHVTIFCLLNSNVDIKNMLTFKIDWSWNVTRSKSIYCWQRSKSVSWWQR